MPQCDDDFERIFNPANIAVVGVSARGWGFGRGMVFALTSMGYAGNLYPVSPNGGTVAGRTILRSVDEIPEPLDFAIIAVPAEGVPEALESCRKKGAAAAEILSAGFAELGTDEGRALDRRVREVAARGIRVLGPNCFGIYCPKSGLTRLPGTDLSRRPGPVALLSQSGGLSMEFANLGKWRGIRFSKMVSFGNGCDLRETEMLEYLRRDPDTGIICMYIEGVDDGRSFFNVLAETAREKPVIVMKGGLSEAGSRAVTSHTASMGGRRKIWEAVLRQCNAVQVRDLQEMTDVALAFSMLPQRVYNGVTVVGGGGALGVNAADTAEAFGLTIPTLASHLQEKIRSMLPQPGSSPTNPIDIANPYVAPDVLKETIIAAAGDDRIQIHAMFQLLHSYKALAAAVGVDGIRQIVPLEALVGAIADASAAGGKPVVMILPNTKQERETLDIEDVVRDARARFIDAGIPVYERIPDAFNAIARVSCYTARKSAMATTPNPRVMDAPAAGAGR